MRESQNVLLIGGRYGIRSHRKDRTASKFRCLLFWLLVFPFVFSCGVTTQPPDKPAEQKMPMEDEVVEVGRESLLRDQRRRFVGDPDFDLVKAHNFYDYQLAIHVISSGATVKVEHGTFHKLDTDASPHSIIASLNNDLVRYQEQSSLQDSHKMVVVWASQATHFDYIYRTLFSIKSTGRFSTVFLGAQSSSGASVVPVTLNTAERDKAALALLSDAMSDETIRLSETRPDSDLYLRTNRIVQRGGLQCAKCSQDDDLYGDDTLRSMAEYFGIEPGSSSQKVITIGVEPNVPHADLVWLLDQLLADPLVKAHIQISLSLSDPVN